MIRAATALAAAFAVAPGVGAADKAEDLFVESNLISIFYHELGHAMIDQLGLPIYGQEEDAADVASILLIHDLFTEDSAEAIAYDVALGFRAEAAFYAELGEGTAWWALHGPDEQRFYNTVCLFYGGVPAARRVFARDMDLPKERRDTCEDEYLQAMDSWGAAFDRLGDLQGSGAPMRFRSRSDSLTADVIAREVEDLNGFFGWPRMLDVVVERCGEENAFYDPETVEVVMCTEYEDHLRRLHAFVDR